MQELDYSKTDEEECDCFCCVNECGYGCNSYCSCELGEKQKDENDEHRFSHQEYGLKKEVNYEY